MLLYFVAITTTVAGWIGAPWWAAVAGGCMISLLLFREDTRVYPPPGEEAAWDVAESLSNVLIGATGAGMLFLLGRLFGIFI